MDNTNDFPNAGSPSGASEQGGPSRVLTPTLAPSRPRGHRLWIAGGAFLAAVALVSGGVAIGAAIADDLEDDSPAFAVSGRAGDDCEGRERQRYGDSDDELDSACAYAEPSALLGGGDSSWGASSADDLIGTLDAALAVEAGAPVSIAFSNDGSATVTIETANGSEVYVRVAGNAKATVTGRDRAEGDDVASQFVLDARTIRSIVTVAVPQGQGRILEIDSDNEPLSPYAVTVMTDDRRIAEITLSAQFNVVETDIDD